MLSVSLVAMARRIRECGISSYAAPTRTGAAERGAERGAAGGAEAVSVSVSVAVVVVVAVTGPAAGDAVRAAMAWVTSSRTTRPPALFR